MKISLLVAVSENNVIGVNNQLPWHLPADLQYFKQLTLEHTIIMGRKTFDSIGKPLPKRENIVITRNNSFKVDGVIAFQTIEDALAYCNNKDEVFIIGGDEIFKQFVNRADFIYRTKVHTYIEDGDAFFDEINLNEWELVKSEKHTKDEKNPFDYTFEIFKRK